MDVEEDDEIAKLRLAALLTMKQPSNPRSRGAVFKPHPFNSNLISIIPLVEEENQVKEEPAVASKFTRFADSQRDSSGAEESDKEQEKRDESETSFEDLIFQLQQALDEEEQGDIKEKAAGATGGSGSKLVLAVSPRKKTAAGPVSSRRLSRSPSLYRNHSPPVLTAQEAAQYTAERDTPSRSPVTPPRKQRPLRLRHPVGTTRSPAARRRWYHPPGRARRRSPPLPQHKRDRWRTRSPSPWSPLDKVEPRPPGPNDSYSSISSSELDSELESKPALKPEPREAARQPKAEVKSPEGRNEARVGMKSSEGPNRQLQDATKSPESRDGILNRGKGEIKSPIAQVVDSRTRTESSPAGSQGVVKRSKGVLKSPENRERIVKRSPENVEGIGNRSKDSLKSPENRKGTINRSRDVLKSPEHREGVVMRSKGVLTSPEAREGVVKRSIGVLTSPENRDGVVKRTKAEVKPPANTKRSKVELRPGEADPGDKENGDSNVPCSCTSSCRASKRSWKTVDTVEAEEELDDVLDLGLERSPDFTSSEDEDGNKAPRARSHASVARTRSPVRKKLGGRTVSLKPVPTNGAVVEKDKTTSSRSKHVKFSSGASRKVKVEKKAGLANGRTKAVTVKREPVSSPEKEVVAPPQAELRSIVCEVGELSSPDNEEEEDDDEDTLVGRVRMDLRAKLVHNRSKRPMSERWYGSNPTRILQSALEGIYVGVRGQENGERVNVKKARPSQEASQRRVFFLDSNSARQNAPSFNVTIPKGAKYNPRGSSPALTRDGRRERTFKFMNFKKGKGAVDAW